MFTFKQKNGPFIILTAIILTCSSCIKTNGSGVTSPENSSNSSGGGSGSGTTIDPNCAWNNMVTNGATSISAGRTEYYCPFFNPGGSSSGNYIFSFYANLKTDNQMMTYPSFVTVDYTIDQATCTLKISQSSVPKFDLTLPTLNGANELTGFHHFCVYCGGNDNAIGCTKRVITH